jgi:hypothetical protein
LKSCPNLKLKGLRMATVAREFDLNAKVEEDMSPRASAQQVEGRSHTGLYAIGVTILIFLLAQTAAIAYWAGQQNKAQQVNEDSVKELKSQIDYIRTQNEVVSKSVAEVKGKLSAEETQRSRK